MLPKLRALPVLLLLGTGHWEVLAAEVGETVVVVEQAAAMIEEGVVGKVPPGTVFVVQKVNGDWLWPSLPQPGWIPLSAVRDLDEGLERFTREIGLNARNAQAHWARGQVHRAKGNLDEAIADFDRVVALAPKSYLGYVSRGTSRLEQQKLDEALADLDEAVELEPTSADAYQLRKLVHAARGDWDRALADAEKAVALAPKDARGLNSRAWLRATCPQESIRDGAVAVADARQACELTGFLNFRCLGTLAAALAEAGEFEEAVKRQRRALELAPPAERAAFEARLKLYEAEKPYRDVPATSASAN